MLRDASNNPISGVVVTATITGSPAGVSRIGTVTATTNASGIASFVGSGLGLSGPVGNYSLTFTAGSVSSSASNAIALSAGTATQLTYTQQPYATASSGTSLGSRACIPSTAIVGGSSNALVATFPTNACGLRDSLSATLATRLPPPT